MCFKIKTIVTLLGNFAKWHVLFIYCLTFTWWWSIRGNMNYDYYTDIITLHTCIHVCRIHFLITFNVVLLRDSSSPTVQVNCLVSMNIYDCTVVLIDFSLSQNCTDWYWLISVSVRTVLIGTDWFQSQPELYWLSSVSARTVLICKIVLWITGRIHVSFVNSL